jgi:hypothetical protein
MLASDAQYLRVLPGYPGFIDDDVIVRQSPDGQAPAGDGYDVPVFRAASDNNVGVHYVLRLSFL